MNNISGIRGCYGCGVCAVACPRKLIDIRLNENGFYEPYMASLSECVDCGLCTDVCSWLHDDCTSSSECGPVTSYAAWSRDNFIRKRCSSGGIGFEIGKYLLSEGYKVCGVRYNAEHGRAEHYIASDVEELTYSIGSKYIQSYTLPGFLSIDKRRKYLIIGTPCQIDSFRRYAKRLRIEQNLVFMDFFCHGVPSMWLWKKYIKEVEKKTGKALYVTWRNKSSYCQDADASNEDAENQFFMNGWHDSYNFFISGQQSVYYSKLSQGDSFYRIFLDDGCLGKSCYERCKFKWKSSSADIRIGDLWGSAYDDNEDGVSCAIAFTGCGAKVLRLCNCDLIEHPFDTVAQGQMHSAPEKPDYYEKLRLCLNSSNTSIYDAELIVKRAQHRRRIKRIFKNPVISALNFLKRFK